ncbi:hypothetical protein D3C75_861450 [compost metagenome]
MRDVKNGVREQHHAVHVLAAEEFLQPRHHQADRTVWTKRQVELGQPLLKLEPGQLAALQQFAEQPISQQREMLTVGLHRPLIGRPGRPLLAQFPLKLADHLDQLVIGNRLKEIGTGLFLYRLAGVFEFRVAGQHHYPDLLPATADGGDKIKAGHFRHIDIGYNDIDGMVLEQLQRLVAGIRLVNLLEAQFPPGNGQGQVVYDVRFVVNQKNLMHHEPLSSPCGA